MARSDQTSFLFEVLEGPAAAQRFELVGRELPFRPSNGGSISFGIEQRIKTTNYPGSREASLQFGGPKLLPTTINGHWSERYLGEDRPISLSETFAELCAQGVLLRVSWQTITREGAIRSFKETPGQTTGGRDEIAWEMVLEWTREVAGPRTPKIQSLPATSIRDECGEVAAGLADVGEQVLGYVASAEFFVGLAKSIFVTDRDALRDSVDDLMPAMIATTEAAREIGLQSTLERRTIESLLATLENSRAAVGHAEAALADLLPGVAQGDDDLITVLNDERTRRDVIESCVHSLRQQWTLAMALEAQVRPEEVARVVAVPGMDLRTLSNRYYGTPDGWEHLRRYNGFASAVVPDGVGEVLVPLALPNAAGGE